MECKKLLSYFVFYFSMCLELEVDASLPFAILHLTKNDGSTYADICALYNPYYSAIPFELSATPKYPVYLSSPQNGCIDHSTYGVWNSSSFVTSDGNCTFFQKLKWAYQAHAKQMILISRKKTLSDFPIGTKKQHEQVHLSVGMIGDTSWEKVTNTIGIPEYAQMYHPHDPAFDPNLIALWFIAVFTVCTGAFWSGITLKQSLKNAKDSESINEDNYNFPPLSIVMVAVFIVMVCIVLLLLYYFYRYLIYVVIGIFAIAAIQGTYDCLSFVTSLCSRGHCRIPENNLPLLKSQPEVRNIIVLLISIALSIFWIIIRNQVYAWILQDFLGVCFCISLLKTFKLPNLKISVILLVALLVYDIFFVFITPFFSAHGKSVMVEVATGHGSLEQLPMVIRIPKFIKTAMSLCERPYSLLGFGDILLPGLFVAFCHNFDVMAKTRYKVYFVATSFGYGIGLLATFVALLMMNTGQPALLYLSPSVLLAAIIVGAIRKELKELWVGHIDPNKLVHQEPSPDIQDDEEDRLIDHQK